MMRRGFTLIELLVVVAIISILATIAVPNFLEAQVRSKVSRVRSDLRTLATALECYAVDNNNKYPFDKDGQLRPGYITDVISTPVAYVTGEAMLKDIFRRNSNGADTVRERFGYCNPASKRELDLWRLSWTPDGPYAGEYPPPCPLDPILGITEDYYCELVAEFGMWRLKSLGPSSEGFPDAEYTEPDYDPTNGTLSRGAIHRSQKNP